MTFRHMFSVLAACSLLATSASALAQDYPTGLEQKPLAEVQASAEFGNKTAQLELGRRFYYVKDSKNDQQALIWFQKAAEQGVPKAEYETAAMYMLGEGTAADPKQALDWYKKTARDGIDVANYDIGAIYIQGSGVPKDDVEAVKWFTIASDKGVPRAQLIMGIFYRDGLGVTQDYPQALKLLQAACAKRQANGCYALGDMIKQGKGTDKNLVVGQAWRIMGRYLNPPAGSVPKGSKIVGAVLYSPDLTEDENKQAEDYYFKLMDQLGFSEKK